MSYETILYDVQDGVATITLNRADSYNSLNQQTIIDLKAALKRIERDQAVRAVVLTGTGKGFSSGADLQEMSGNLDIPITEYLQAGLHTLITQMRALEKPVVCGVNGVAAGAGAGLALACDLRLASDNASFVLAAFVNIGIVPDSGTTYTLSALVGPAKALELVLLADSKNRVSAEDALALGIVNRVVAADALMTETEALARKLAKMPTLAIGMTKRAIYRAGERSLNDALAYESQLQGAAFRTQDFREGVMAFVEKREPIFKGE